jgi:GNAT superfamily N-acetyltransferase
MSFVVMRLACVTDAQIVALARLLIDCVEDGASVSFMSPLSLDKASAFWRRVAEATVRGERALLVAQDSGGIIGTVQLILDLPENQPHRADLSKMLVHRSARRQGVAAAMLRAAEELARELGKSLLLLDTASTEAGRLYARLGWERVGIVPDFALLPGGSLCHTTFYYRRLEPQHLTLVDSDGRADQRHRSLD